MPRNSTATKQRILEAGLLCFAQGGFAGTTTRTIAKAADVSLPLLQRYFGGKQGLFDAVMHAVLQEYEDTQSMQWELPEHDPMFFIEGLTTLFQWYGERPQLLRLTAWVRLERQTIAMGPFDAYWARLRARIVAGQRAGLVRADADPEAALLAIDAMFKGYWERRHAAIHAFTAESDLDRRVMLTMVGFAVRSLLNPEYAEPALASLRERLLTPEQLSAKL